MLKPREAFERLHVTLPTSLAQALDDYCERLGRSRSDVIRTLIKKELDE